MTRTIRACHLTITTKGQPHLRMGKCTAAAVTRHPAVISKNRLCSQRWISASQLCVTHYAYPDQNGLIGRPYHTPKMPQTNTSKQSSQTIVTAPQMQLEWRKQSGYFCFTQAHISRYIKAITCDYHTQVFYARHALSPKFCEPARLWSGD